MQSMRTLGWRSSAEILLDALGRIVTEKALVRSDSPLAKTAARLAAAPGSDPQRACKAVMMLLIALAQRDSYSEKPAIVRPRAKRNASCS